MDHNLGVRQRVALAFRSAREENRAPACRQTDAVRGDGAGEDLHRVVDRERGGHAAARRVNIEINIFTAIDALEIEQFHNQFVGGPAGNFTLQKDDAVVQKQIADRHIALTLVPFVPGAGVH